MHRFRAGADRAEMPDLDASDSLFAGEASYAPPGP
jgi:hypothetical protein